MSTTKGETNWRDLIADLTVDDITYLEAMEARLMRLGPPADVAAVMLDQARGHIEDRIVASMFARVPAPAGAPVDRWERDYTGGWYRELTWREMGTGAIGVAVNGRQGADGHIERSVSVYCDGRVGLDVEAARQLAAELIAAADLLDSLPPQ